jgi:hypothetical protein
MNDRLTITYSRLIISFPLDCKIKFFFYFTLLRETILSPEQTPPFADYKLSILVIYN